MGDETDRIRLKLAKKRWGIRRVAIAVVGFTVLLLGLAGLFLPGPGTLLIVVGLAILATEFFWAWQAKRFVERKAREATRKAKRRRESAYLDPPARDDERQIDPFPR